MGKIHDRLASRQKATDKEPSGSIPEESPTTNRGVIRSEEGTSRSAPIGTDRGRINLSVPPHVDEALTAAAEALGTTKAHLALHLVLDGLPRLAEAVRAVRELKGPAA